MIMNEDHKQVLTRIREQQTLMIRELRTIADSRPEYGREVSLAVTKLQESRMWAGTALAILEGVDPFGQSEIKK